MKKFSIISIIIILSLSYNIYSKVKETNEKRRNTMLEKISEENKELSPIYDF